MLITLNGFDAYAYTGGKPFDPAQPTVVFIHGAQNNHSVWALQSRYFAHHGFNVLALDLPGHGRSNGAALASIEALAGWVGEFLDVLGVAQVMLVGHSMGALVALELAAQAPARVHHLALIGIAYPMKVSDELLEAAENDPQRAIAMVNSWSHSAATQRPAASAPGVNVMGVSQRLMQRIAAINPASVMHTDFSACNAYANGERAAQALRCPTLFLLGKRDIMTPVKASAALTQAIPQAQLQLLDHCAHDMMAEQPDQVLDALFGFARSSVGSRA